MVLVVDKTNSMLLGDTNDEHIINDKECVICWSGYPIQCECGGLIHATFGDEDSDCNYWCYTQCDKCGKHE
jgi:hypothetical protein